MSTTNQPDISFAIAGFVRAHFPQFAKADVSKDTELLARGLDSLAVLDLMTFLSEQYHLELAEEDFVEENFETVGSLSRLVARKLS